MHISSQDLKDFAVITQQLAQYDERPILARPILADRLMSLFRADFLGQTRWNAQTKVFENPICYNRDAQMSWAYESHYQFCDPISKRLRHRLRATPSYAVITRQDLQRTEYYNDFLRPFGVSHGLDQYLFADGQNIGDLRIWRRQPGNAFDDRDIQLVTALRPLLVNAYRNMQVGDTLEARVSDSDQLIAAMSGDGRRFICSPGLTCWLATQNGIDASGLRSTVSATLSSGQNQATFARYRLSINRRQVSAGSLCAVLCTVFPNAVELPFQRLARRLTQREHQVADLICKAYTDAQIATQLGISYWTVRSHVGKLLRKLKVRNRVALVNQRRRFGDHW